jgi:uncharacterized protein YjbI with pentapeptide repeats
VFEGVNLTGAVFPPATYKSRNRYVEIKSNTFLENVSFIGSVLDGVHLEGSVLKGAQFSGASLAGIHLEDSDLRRSRLNGALNIQGAHLEGANLSEQDLRGMDLRGVHLEGANLTGAHLEGANLTGAFLDGADLTEAHIDNTNFTGASLKGSILIELYGFCNRTLRYNDDVRHRIIIELSRRKLHLTFDQLRNARNEGAIRKLLNGHAYSITHENQEKIFSGKLRPYHVLTYHPHPLTMRRNETSHIKRECYNMLKQNGINREEVEDRCCSDPEGTIASLQSETKLAGPDMTTVLPQQTRTVNQRLHDSIVAFTNEIYGQRGEDSPNYGTRRGGGRGRGQSNKTKKRHNRLST